MTNDIDFLYHCHKIVKDYPVLKWAGERSFPFVGNEVKSYRVHNGNLTEWSAIWSEIKRVITSLISHPKLHDRKFNFHFIINNLKSKTRAVARHDNWGGGCIFIYSCLHTVKTQNRYAVRTCCMPSKP